MVVCSQKPMDIGVPKQFVCSILFMAEEPDLADLVEHNEM